MQPCLQSRPAAATTAVCHDLWGRPVAQGQGSRLEEWVSRRGDFDRSGIVVKVRNISPAPVLRMRPPKSKEHGHLCATGDLRPAGMVLNDATPLGRRPAQRLGMTCLRATADGRGLWSRLGPSAGDGARRLGSRHAQAPASLMTSRREVSGLWVLSPT